MMQKFMAKTDRSTNRKLSGKRAVVSIGLLILFILLILSAIMIQVGEDDPSSRSHHVWTGLHTGCGIMSIGFVTFHLIYNRKIFGSYLGRKNR
jgi:hypothetical protein